MIIIHDKITISNIKQISFILICGLVCFFFVHFNMTLCISNCTVLLNVSKEFLGRITSSVHWLLRIVTVFILHTGVGFRSSVGLLLRSILCLDQIQNYPDCCLTYIKNTELDLSVCSSDKRLNKCFQSSLGTILVTASLIPFPHSNMWSKLKWKDKIQQYTCLYLSITTHFLCTMYIMWWQRHFLVIECVGLPSKFILGFSSFLSSKESINLLKCLKITPIRTGAF